MHIIFKISLLLLLNYYCFTLAGLWFGFISLGIIIYKILSYLGITRNPEIFLGHFDEGITFTKDYYGSYTTHKEAFCEALRLIETYNLQNYIVIALYYDSPGYVEEDKLRSSIGIYTKKSFYNNENEEFEKYCQENGYNKNELPSSSSLFCNWEFFNFTSMIIGVQKFYKLMFSKLKNGDYKKEYNIDESKIKIMIESYDYPNSTMTFYVPIQNNDKYMIFKKIKNE